MDAAARPLERHVGLASTLRHRRVTTWLAQGKSPVLVEKAMGYANLATTTGYTHRVDEYLLALVEEPEYGLLRALFGHIPCPRCVQNGRFGG